MAVDTCHPDYDAMAPVWCVMTDVLAGEDAVKAASDKYLPRFAEGDEEEYHAYKERATFFEITGRARDAMSGFLFRKDPNVKVPAEKDDGTSGNPILQEFIDDATLSGKSFYDIAKDLADKVLGKARGGAWIDWSDEEGQPYVMLYCAEDIINWRYQRIKGRMMLTMIMLCEQDTTYYQITGETQGDEYEVVYYDQWRELNLEEDGQGGYFVSATLWRRRKPTKGKRQKGLKGTGAAPGAGISSADEFVQVDYSIPMRRGATLQEIPFVFCTSKGPDGSVVPKPPLYGMAKQNLSHYRSEADWENALHILGMPTPWAAGFQQDEADELYLGATKAWTTGDPSARCGFLALQGGDIAPLNDALEAKERRMAELGARLLDPKATQTPEAYQTVAMRQTGETSVLTDISLSLTQSLQDLLAWALWWSSPAADRQAAEKDVGYTVNTDFLGGIIDPAMLTALMQAYLQKAISFETLFEKLQTGEIIAPDVTVEEEKQRIQDGADMQLGPLPQQLQKLQLQLGGQAPGAKGKPPIPPGQQQQQPPPPPAGKKPPPKPPAAAPKK